MMNSRTLSFAPMPTLGEKLPIVIRLLHQLKRKSPVGLRLIIRMSLLSVLYIPVLAAQSESSVSSNVSPNVTGTIVAMFLLFPVGEELDQNSNIELPKNIAIFGLDDESLRDDLESRVLDLVKKRDEAALVEIVTEYSFIIDMENSSDTTLALRSPPIGNLEALFALSVQNREFDQVKKMLDQEAIDVNKAIKINDVEFVAFTPITRAAFTQDMKMIQLLLNYGADPNLAGESVVHPPITHAVKNHNLDMTRLLLDSGATADFDSNRYGGEPLALWAAQIDDLSLIKLLIEHGVDPAQTGAYGWTPLSEAILSKNMQMAEFLINSNDPRILIAQAMPGSLHNRFDDRYFPSTNALHLARHFLDPASSEKLINQILNRAKELGGDTALTLMELQARRSASELAYAELNTPEAVKQRELGLDHVDVYSLDAGSNADLVNASRDMLINLHELCIIAGIPFSVDNREKAAHIGLIDDEYIKWHDMLDIMETASNQDATQQLNQWRNDYGDPVESRWNYDMLLSWADEEISDRVDRVRVYETIDVFRKIKVFTGN